MNFSQNASVGRCRESVSTTAQKEQLHITDREKKTKGTDKELKPNHTQGQFVHDTTSRQLTTQLFINIWLSWDNTLNSPFTLHCGETGTMGQKGHRHKTEQVGGIVPFCTQPVFVRCTNLPPSWMLIPPIGVIQSCKTDHGDLKILNLLYVHHRRGSIHTYLTCNFHCEADKNMLVLLVLVWLDVHFLITDKTDFWYCVLV